MSIIVLNHKDIRNIRSDVMRGTIIAMQRADSKAKANKAASKK
jgi:hypothetical protein